MSEFTLDRFDRTVELFQPRVGYRFNEEALRLVRFVLETMPARPLPRWVDLGCGVGAIALALAAKLPSIRIDGIELQPTLAELARRNALHNRLDDRVTIHQADLRALGPLSPTLPPNGFDGAVINPPFYRAGAGKPNPTDQKRIARHEVALTLEEWAAAAAWLLRDGAPLWLVFPAERLVDLFVALRANRLEPKEMRLVQPRANAPAETAQVKAVKGAGPELLIRTETAAAEGE